MAKVCKRPRQGYIRTRQDSSRKRETGAEGHRQVANAAVNATALKPALNVDSPLSFFGERQSGAMWAGNASSCGGVDCTTHKCRDRNGEPEKWRKGGRGAEKKRLGPMQSSTVLPMSAIDSRK